MNNEETRNTSSEAQNVKEETGRGHGSFLIKMPDVPNIYELVVVAAQRARQINVASRILPPENGVKPVEKALSEALAGQVKYEVSDKPTKESA